MDSKRTKQIFVVTALTGMTVALHAADLPTVTAKTTPDVYNNAPNAQTVQKFFNAHQATGVSVDDMLQFSATIERKDNIAAATGLMPVMASPLSAAPGSVLSNASLSTFKLPSIPSPLSRAQAQAGSSGSAQGPCPTGFQSSQPALNQDVTCWQNDPPEQPAYVESQFVLHPDETPQLSGASFGSSEWVSYGSVVQDVYNSSQPGALAQYQNYYFGDLQSAQLAANYECSQGFPVTYITGVWPVANSSTPPSSGYQVQWADFKPGDSTDQSPIPPQDLSPVPAGDSNYCLTLPPPNNN